uniref:CRAL-TRIO domain-containing protein n=1 Tax=Clastoptera arizonana TaxID=38151 RepID=A0A1B6DGL7_9HEMI
MAEFCDIDWNGYRGLVNSPHIQIESTPIKDKIVDKDIALQTIRNKITTIQLNEFTRTDDEFLMRFIRARKMNVEESYLLLCNYYDYRKKNQELFDNMTLKDTLIQQALYDGFPGVLANRDRKGRCIILFFCNHWDHCNYSLEVIYRSLLLSLDKLLDNPQNQFNGFVFVVDWTDFSLRQSTNLSPRILKSMIDGLQDCFPARFKGIHFVNQPWYVEAALAVIKPFLKNKTRDKIFVHGNNLSTLHEAVSKDILPSELGGETGSYNPMLWAEQMLRPETAPKISDKDPWKVYPDGN